MNAAQAQERLIKHIHDYAAMKRAAIDEGAVTVRLAALLLKQYGQGLSIAAGMIFNDIGIATDLAAVVDQEVQATDPDWRKNTSERSSTKRLDVAQARRSSL